MTKLSQLICILERNGENMKKFWLYLAVPAVLLNGCQRQRAALKEAESLAVESVESERREGEDSEGIMEKVENEKRRQETDESPETKSEITDSFTAGNETVNGETSRSENGNSEAGKKQVKEAPFFGSTVSIVQSEKAQASQITEEEIESMVREAAWDLHTVVKNGQTVVLKPNLVQMIVDSTGEILEQEVNGITTDWRVAKAVVKMVRELNPDGKVYIMEGSATGPTRKVMEHYHYTEEYMEGVDGFICLEEDCGGWKDFEAQEVVKVDTPDGLLHKSYYFNRILYDADVVISIPALKTTSGVVVTAGIKNVSIGTPPGNLYGIGPDIPSKQQMVSHKIVDGELDKWIYDYYKAKPVNYVIVDGLQGFQSGPVPMSSQKRETDKMNMRLVLAGKDPVAVDTVCCLVMGWDPESVGYLNLFREKDGLGKLTDLRVRGVYVDQVRKHFTIFKENLGGVPIEDGEGPDFSAEVETEGNQITIHYQAEEETSKIEVWVDGMFQCLKEAEEEGQIHLIVPDFSEGDHEIRIVAFDRFLNKTVYEIAAGRSSNS